MVRRGAVRAVRGPRRSRAPTPAGRRDPAQHPPADLRLPLRRPAGPHRGHGPGPDRLPAGSRRLARRLSVLTVLTFAAASDHPRRRRPRLVLGRPAGARRRARRLRRRGRRCRTGFPFGHYDYSHRLGPAPGRRTAARAPRLADDGLPVPADGPTPGRSVRRDWPDRPRPKDSRHRSYRRGRSRGLGRLPRPADGRGRQLDLAASRRRGCPASPRCR